MSHALYATRLYWAANRGGVAKLHGQCVPLHAPPHFGGAPVVGVDYIPEVGMRQIMPYGCAWRDMTDVEVSEADALLRRLLTAPTGTQ